MASSLKRIQSVAAGCCVVFAISLTPPVLARDVRVPKPIFDTAAVREFPQTVFDEIAAQITYQTTFQQITPAGLIRWSTRTMKLVDFVVSPSHNDPDASLYAMRYLVNVMSEKDTLAVFGTSCQVVVVFKGGGYDEPIVVCEPVNLDRPAAS